MNVITGITSQSGIYLSNLLTNRGEKVIGLTRSTSHKNLKEIDKRVQVIEFDYLNMKLLNPIFENENSICIYNIVAQSSVSYSFTNQIETMELNYNFVIGLLKTIRTFSKDKQIKLIQVGSSEMFGHNSDLPWSESTKFSPQSPYAVSKVLAFEYCEDLKNRFHLWISNVIMFNNESRYRKKGMLTKQIASQISEIQTGIRTKIEIEDLNISRDWMHTSDSARALFEISKLDTPTNFVVASSKETSLLELINIFLRVSNISKDVPILSSKAPTFKSYYARRVVGDNTKLLNSTSWHQTVSLEDMVRDIRINNDK
jgi:GDPmannose 4,6-dehydratase